MKIKTVFFIITLFTLGCSDEPMTSTVDIEKFRGIWVPYEIKNSDGTIISGPFTNGSIFGVYAESIKFIDNNGYIPVIWTESNNFRLKTTERGIFEILDETKLILTGGIWEMEFEIAKLSDDEMWLSYIGEVSLLGPPNTRYKLKREVSNY